MKQFGEEGKCRTEIFVYFKYLELSTKFCRIWYFMCGFSINFCPPASVCFLPQNITESITARLMSSTVHVPAAYVWCHR